MKFFDISHYRKVFVDKDPQNTVHSFEDVFGLAGIRDSNKVGDVTYSYLTLDGKVVRQTWTENGIDHVFDIIYDASGLPYSCVYDGSRYYYVLNQQGDVIRIVGYLGATLCEYQYDAWGNVLDISGPPGAFQSKCPGILRLGSQCISHYPLNKTPDPRDPGFSLTEESVICKTLAVNEYGDIF